MKSLFQNCILYLLGLSLCNIIYFFDDDLNHSSVTNIQKINKKNQEGGKNFFTPLYIYIYIYIYIVYVCISVMSHQENQTCLCDSICQAFAQVQWHPFTSVAGKYALVLHAEIVVLLVKEAIETTSPAEMKKGFCSPYFIVPKKGGGLRPVLGVTHYK